MNTAMNHLRRFLLTEKRPAMRHWSIDELETHVTDYAIWLARTRNISGRTIGGYTRAVLRFAAHRWKKSILPHARKRIETMLKRMAEHAGRKPRKRRPVIPPRVLGYLIRHKSIEIGMRAAILSFLASGARPSELLPRQDRFRPELDINTTDVRLGKRSIFISTWRKNDLEVGTGVALHQAKDKAVCPVHAFWEHWRRRPRPFNRKKERLPIFVHDDGREITSSDVTTALRRAARATGKPKKNPTYQRPRSDILPPQCCTAREPVRRSKKGGVTGDPRHTETTCDNCRRGGENSKLGCCDN